MRYKVETGIGTSYIIFEDGPEGKRKAFELFDDLVIKEKRKHVRLLEIKDVFDEGKVIKGQPFFKDLSDL